MSQRERWITKLPKKPEDHNHAEHGCSELGDGVFECGYARDPYCWSTISDSPTDRRKPTGIHWLTRWDQLYAEGFRRVRITIEEVEVEAKPLPYVPPPPPEGSISIGASPIASSRINIASGRTNVAIGRAAAPSQSDAESCDA